MLIQNLGVMGLMKKLAVVTTLIGVLALAACGGGAEEEEGNETESTETEGG